MTQDKLVLTEGDLERIKRLAAVKDCEITRLKEDLNAEQSHLSKETERVKRLQQLLKETQDTSCDGEDQCFTLELQVINFFITRWIASF